MSLKRKIWGLVTAVAVMAGTTLAQALPASATSVSINSGATSNSFTTPTSGFTAAAINSSQISFPNPLGGMYEVTPANSTSTTLTVQAFNNGAMDTRFNTTGSSSFTAQYAPNTRGKLYFSTYANGTKWAVLENSWSSSGYNYLYLGTVAGGYQSTITLPTPSSANSTCTTKAAAVNAGAISSLADITLAPDTGAANPILSLNCGVYLNTATNYFNWLVTYSGGGTLGTPATLSDWTTSPTGPLNLLNSSTKKYVINYGVSANPNATGSQIALTYFSALTDTNPNGASPTTGDTFPMNDLVVTRVSASGAVTQQAGAWTSQSAGGRTGMVVVVPRNNGTVYALLNATDGTNYVAKILTFGATGAATAQTNVTGASFVTGFSRVATMENQGTTLKFFSLDLGGYNPSLYTEVNASTAVATQVASFVVNGGGSYESFMWQIANTADGADFYSRTNATSVMRVRTSSSPMVPSSPATPSVVIGNTYAILTWAAVSDGGSPVTAYTVEYSTNGVTWTTFANNITTLGTTVTGLTNNTAYIFRVSATNAIGTSTASVATSGVTPLPVPEPPTSLIVTGNGSNSLTFNWTAPSSGGSAITDYRLEYQNVSSGVWATLTHATSTATTLSSAFANGFTYAFRVSAINSYGVGPMSAVSTSYLMANVPSGITQTPVVTATPGNFSVSWVLPANGGSALTGVEVQTSTDGTSFTNSFTSADLTGTVSVTGLTAGVAYYTRVRARNFFGYSGTWSPTTAAVTMLGITAPSTVTGVTATSGVSAGTVNLSWTTPSANGSAITDYTIQYSANSGSTWLTWTHSASTATSAVVTGLTPGGSYVLRVAAVNGIGTGTASSASAAVTATAASAPGTVTGLTSTAGASAGTVDLSWTAPASNGSPITDYTIQYSSDGGVTWQTWTHSASSSTAATVTGLTAGTNYIFKVSAVNGVGSSTPTTPTSPVAAAQPAQQQSSPSTPSTPNPVQVPTNVQAPSKVDAAAGKVTFSGNNMENVKTVLMNNIEAPILDRNAQNLTVKIPKEILGWVDVEFITPTGKSKFMSLIYVENVAAGQIAKLRLGYEKPTILKAKSTKRFNLLSDKFKNATTATCVGYIGQGISRAQAIANAKHACGLVVGRTHKATARIAVSKEQLHAHVLVLFDY